MPAGASNSSPPTVKRARPRDDDVDLLVAGAASLCSSTTMSPTFSAVYAFMPKARMPSRRRIGRHSSPSATGIRSSSSILSTLYLLTLEHLPVEIVEPAQLLERPLVVVDAEVDEGVRELRIARVALRRRAARPTAGLCCRRRLPGRRRGSRGAAWQSGLPALPSNVSASASTVASETRMFPCAA